MVLSKKVYFSDHFLSKAKSMCENISMIICEIILFGFVAASFKWHVLTFPFK